MKKITTTVIVFLAVGLAMVLIGGILQGIQWGQTSSFDGQAFAEALNNIGYIVSMISGVVLAGIGVASAIKGDDCKSNDNQDKDKKN